MAAHKCFACGSPTNTTVQNVSAPFRRRYVCKELACMKKWWALKEG